MVTIENVRNALVEIWGCNCGFAEWVWEQAADDGSSFHSVWEAAVVRVADKLGAKPDETGDVMDTLADLTDADDLETVHSDGLCEYRDREDMAAERAYAWEVCYGDEER